MGLYHPYLGINFFFNMQDIFSLLSLQLYLHRIAGLKVRYIFNFSGCHKTVSFNSEDHTQHPCQQ